jgi:phosphoglycolate phosphatase
MHRTLAFAIVAVVLRDQCLASLGFRSFLSLDEKMRCNICGCNSFVDMWERPNVRCVECGSLERTRVVALHLAHYVKPQPGDRILHFAPERGLAQMLRGIDGVHYRGVDIRPELYPGLSVERFDLCRDVFEMPYGSYDLIILNHVLEHIECNYTMVLIRLAEALTVTGTMLFSVPILPGHFSDELIDLPEAEKVEYFGPTLHVRRFGRDYLRETLGMIFRIPERYDLRASFSEADLIEFNIPRHHWSNYTGASVFRMQRHDLRV